MVNDAEAAFLAGLIEGEGYFTKDEQIAVGMTDEDVIRRAHRIAGVGRVNGPYQDKKNRHHKKHWRWHVARVDEVLALCKAIRPWMGERRGLAVDVVIARTTERIAAREERRNLRHGTVQRYNKGCRCDECRTVTMTYHRNLRDNKTLRLLNPVRDFELVF